MNILQNNTSLLNAQNKRNLCMYRGEAFASMHNLSKNSMNNYSPNLHIKYTKHIFVNADDIENEMKNAVKGDLQYLKK